MPINQISPKRLADTIVEQLETMILEGTLEPGQRLPPERALAGTIWRIAPLTERSNTTSDGQRLTEEPPGRGQLRSR